MRRSICSHCGLGCAIPAGAARGEGAAGAAMAGDAVSARSRVRASRPADRNPPPSVECAATMTGNDITGTAAPALPRAPSAPRALAPLIDIGINLAHDSYDA